MDPGAPGSKASFVPQVKVADLSRVQIKATYLVKEKEIKKHKVGFV